MSKATTKSAKLVGTNSDLFSFIKALIVSLIITFLCIIIFALFIKWFNLNDSVIVPINLIIKGLAIIFGTLIFTKNRVGGLKKGLLFAFSYITLAFVIFSALAGKFEVSLGLGLDYVFGLIVGALVGVLKVNSKKSNI